MKLVLNKLLITFSIFISFLVSNYCNAQHYLYSHINSGTHFLPRTILDKTKLQAGIPLSYGIGYAFSKDQVLLNLDVSHESNQWRETIYLDLTSGLKNQQFIAKKQTLSVNTNMNYYLKESKTFKSYFGVGILANYRKWDYEASSNKINKAKWIINPSITFIGLETRVKKVRMNVELSSSNAGILRLKFLKQI
jgi:hypothetical protein